MSNINPKFFLSSISDWLVVGWLVVGGRLVGGRWSVVGSRLVGGFKKIRQRPQSISSKSKLKGSGAYQANQNGRGLGRVRSKKLLQNTINHKIFQTNSSFHVKQCTTGKVQFLFFRRFLLVLARIFISGGGPSTKQ